MRKPTTRGAGQRADEATSGETTEMDDVDGASVGDSHGEDLQIMPEPADATQDTKRITCRIPCLNLTETLTKVT